MGNGSSGRALAERGNSNSDASDITRILDYPYELGVLMSIRQDLVIGLAMP